MANMFKDNETKNNVEGKIRGAQAASETASVKSVTKTETEKPAKEKTARQVREPKPAKEKLSIDDILQKQKKQPGMTCSFYLDINIVEEINKLAEKNKMKKSEVVNEILKSVLLG